MQFAVGGGNSHSVKYSFSEFVHPSVLRALQNTEVPADNEVIAEHYKLGDYVGEIMDCGDLGEVYEMYGTFNESQNSLDMGSPETRKPSTKISLEKIKEVNRLECELLEDDSYMTAKQRSQLKKTITEENDTVKTDTEARRYLRKTNNLTVTGSRGKRGPYKTSKNLRKSTSLPAIASTLQPGSEVPVSVSVSEGSSSSTLIDGRAEGGAGGQEPVGGTDTLNSDDSSDSGSDSGMGKNSGEVDGDGDRDSNSNSNDNSGANVDAADDAHIIADSDAYDDCDSDTITSLPQFPPLDPIPYIPPSGPKRAKAADSDSGKRAQAESGTYWNDPDPILMDVEEEDSFAGGDTDNCTEDNLGHDIGTDIGNDIGTDVNDNDVNVNGDIDDDNTSNSNGHSVPPSTPSSRRQSACPRDISATGDADSAEQLSRSDTPISMSMSIPVDGEQDDMVDDRAIRAFTASTDTATANAGAIYSTSDKGTKPTKASQRSHGSPSAVSYLAVPPSAVTCLPVPPSIPIEISKDIVDLTEEDDSSDAKKTTSSRSEKEMEKGEEKGKENVKVVEMQKGKEKKQKKEKVGLKESPSAATKSERVSDEGTDDGDLDVDLDDTEDSREGDDTEGGGSIEMDADNDVEKPVEEKVVKVESKKSTGVKNAGDAGGDDDDRKPRTDPHSGPSTTGRRSERLNPTNEEKRENGMGGRLKRKKRSSDSGSDSDFEHSESEGPRKKASKGKNGTKVKRSDDDEEEGLEDSESDDDDDFELLDSDVEVIGKAISKSKPSAISELEDGINAEWNLIKGQEETNSFFRPRPSDNSSSSSSSSAHPKKFIMSRETKLQEMENRRLQKDKKAFKFFEQTNGKHSEFREGCFLFCVRTAMLSSVIAPVLVALFCPAFCRSDSHHHIFSCWM
jgi:hypothetical protein